MGSSENVAELELDDEDLDEYTLKQRSEAEKQLQSHLQESLAHCSRQKLRSIQMSLKKQSNVDSRLSKKDLLLVFQNHDVSVDPVTLQMLADKCKDPRGNLEYQKLWRVLCIAQSNTGRESVLAKLKVNKLKGPTGQGDLKRRSSVLDLLMRLKFQMKSRKKQTTEVLRGKIYRLKDACHAMDVDENGRLERSQLIQLVIDHKLEIDDTLLNDLVDRCDGRTTRDSGSMPGRGSWREMIELLEKANEQTLRRSSSSDSITSSSHSSTPSPPHSSPFSSSNQSPKMTKTGKQQYTGPQGLVQRIGQIKVPAGSTSSSNSNFVAVELRKDMQRREVLPAMTRTGAKSLQTKNGSNQQPMAKPIVRYMYGSVKPDGVSQQTISRVDFPFSKNTARVGRAVNQVFPKGKASYQTTSKLGGSSTLTVAKQGGATSEATSKEGVASAELTAKRLIRNEKIISVDKENQVRIEKPLNGAQQSYSSKTASTSSFRKAEGVKAVKLNFQNRQSNFPSTPSEGTANVSAYSSSHMGKLSENNADEILPTSGIIPGSRGTKIYLVKPLETHDLETSVSSENLDSVPEREPVQNKSGGGKMLMEILNRDDEEAEKGSVEAKENIESPDESPAEKRHLESSVDEEVDGSDSELQEETVQVTDRAVEELEEKEGDKNVSSQLNKPELSQGHGQFEKQVTSGDEDKGNEAHCMKFECKNRTMLLPIPDKYRGAKHSEGPLKKKLDLKWVYGYSFDGGSGDLLCLKSTGELVYSSGNFVVIYSRRKHSQRHYLEHTSHVTSLAVHSDGVTVASGQGAKNTENTNVQVTEIALYFKSGHVRVWSSVSLKTERIIGLGLIRHSIQAISFSNDQNLMCCLEGGESPRMLIWSVKTKELIAVATLKVNITARLSFSPSSNEMLILGGEEHLGWWKVSKSDAAIFIHHQATVDGSMWPRSNDCVTSILISERGDLVTGDSTGSVRVWNSRQCTCLNVIVKAHESPVMSIIMLRYATLVTSGEDGSIRGWRWNRTQPMEQIGELKIEEGKICQMAASDDVIYISTSNNSILTAVLAPRALRNPLMGVSLGKVPVTQGHSEAITKICVPRRSRMGDLMVSSSHDGTVCVFDYQKRIPVYKYHLKNKEIVSVDVNDSATLLAVATTDTVRVHEITKPETGVVHFRKIFEPKVLGKSLILIKIAPDGKMISVADALGHIYILGIVENQRGKPLWDIVTDWQASDAGDYIESFDWSTPSDHVTYYIRTMTKNMRLAVWNRDKGMRVNDLAFIANLQWASNTCKITYETSGIWTSRAVGDGQAVICSLDIHDDHRLVAAGQRTGHISIFRLPCVQGEQTDYVRFMGHSHAVNDVAFSADGNQILTIGGSTIAQWRILTAK